MGFAFKQSVGPWALIGSISLLGASHVWAQSCTGQTTNISTATTTSINVTSNECLNVLSSGSINTSTITGESISIGASVNGAAIQNAGTIGPASVTSVAPTILNFGTASSLMNQGTITSNNMSGAVDNTRGTFSVLSNTGLIAGTNSSNGITNWGLITSLSNTDGGSITATDSGIAIFNGDTIATLNNGRGSIISATQVDSANWINTIFNVGRIDSLLNEGTISAVDTLTTNANAFAISNNDAHAVIGHLSNVGTIRATSIGGAQAIRNHGTINSLLNSGTITGETISNSLGLGIVNVTNASIVDLNNTGTISGLAASGGTTYGLLNMEGATITTLTNSGTIQARTTNSERGEYGFEYGISNSGLIDALNNAGTISTAGVGKFSIYNDGTINTLNNSGTISAGEASTVIWNYGTIGALTNSGTISAGHRGSGLYTGNGLDRLVNSGTITVGDDGYGIYNPGAITSLINSGTISAGNNGWGVYNYPYSDSAIHTLTNTGVISGGSVGIWNGGTITTLNNAQGGNSSSPSTTALTYNGNLPSNYNIIINSPSRYGQLNLLGASGTMAFNIYGNTGTTLVDGVPASRITTNRYFNVLSGLYDLSNVTGTTGTYGRLNYRLVPDAAIENSWDLLFDLSVVDTQSSLESSAHALRSVYALQTSTLAAGLNYDCAIFDKNGVCVSAGGRYNRVNTGETKAANGLLMGAYQVHPHLRLGAWVDQNLSVNTGAGIRLSNSKPMFGVFGVWSADRSGQGLALKVSAGYGDKDLTVTREVIGSSEAGSGTTRLTTQGVSAVVSYHAPVMANWIASPYLGARYTKIKSSAYTESDAISLPLTYGELKQEAATALAGIHLSGRWTSKMGVFAGLGAELDTTTRGNNYLATGMDGLTAITFSPNMKRLRGSANIGAYFDVDKAQRISWSTVYREEAFSSINTLSSMLVYTAGF